MQPVKKYKISRNTFFPTPKIDLALIIAKPRDDISRFLLSEEERKFFLKFVAGIMPYKNKNIANAISLFLKTENLNTISKDDIYNHINDIGSVEKKTAQYKVDEIVELCKAGTPSDETLNSYRKEVGNNRFQFILDIVGKLDPKAKELIPKDIGERFSDFLTSI